MQSKLPAHTQATLWFDELYNKHKNNHENIPWARLKVNPLLAAYLESHDKHIGKALVIGCGLGDDARALEVAGYDVLAIDISKSALDVAKQRFPQASVRFEQENIFEMPQRYKNHFDFVFEAFTIQSLPITFRENMIKSIVNTLDVDGKLLVVAHKKDKDFQGPPWPLIEEDIAFFKLHGLNELSYEIHNEDSPISPRKFKILYQKP